MACSCRCDLTITIPTTSIPAPAPIATCLLIPISTPIVVLPAVTPTRTPTLVTRPALATPAVPIHQAYKVNGFLGSPKKFQVGSKEVLRGSKEVL